MFCSFSFVFCCYGFTILILQLPLKNQRKASFCLVGKNVNGKNVMRETICIILSTSYVYISNLVKAYGFMLKKII